MLGARCVLQYGVEGPLCRRPAEISRGERRGGTLALGAEIFLASGQSVASSSHLSRARQSYSVSIFFSLSLFLCRVVDRYMYVGIQVGVRKRYSCVCEVDTEVLECWIPLTRTFYIWSAGGLVEINYFAMFFFLCLWINFRRDINRFLLIYIVFVNGIEIQLWCVKLIVIKSKYRKFSNFNSISIIRYTRHT